MDVLNHRLSIDKIFESTFPDFIDDVKKRIFPLPENDEDYECYDNLINIYSKTCGEPDTYTMKYYGAFLHQCKAIKYYAAALDDFKSKISAACEKTA